MIIYIIVICILIILLGAFIYFSINLFRKTEFLEDRLSDQLLMFEDISNRISESHKKLMEVDRKGSFESDDEVGFFFKELLKIQQILNDFKI